MKITLESIISIGDMKAGTGLKVFSGTDVDIYVYGNNQLKINIECDMRRMIGVKR